MIDKKSYEEYRNMYIKEMPNRFQKKSKGNIESYGELDKWIGIKEFQSNWNLDSPDIFDMFKKSTRYIVNFLDIKGVFPVRMLKVIINEEPNCFKNAFNKLFDRSKSLKDRCNDFNEIIDDFKNRKHSDDQFFNNLHLATFFEVMMYPEECYIYNYENNSYSMRVLSKEGITTSKPFDRYMQFSLFAEEVRKIIIKDNILRNEFEKYKNDMCYEDDNCYMLCTDFLYYIGDKEKKESNEKEENDLIPENLNIEKLEMLINRYKKDYKENDYIKDQIDKRNSKKETLYGNLTSEKILNFTKEEFKDLLVRMWAVGGLQANDIISKNDFATIKKLISNLLFGTENISKRYNECRDNCWGFKSAAITEMLTNIYPNDYMLVNTNIDLVFKYLDIDVNKDMNYNNFLSYLKIGKFIQKKINDALGTNYNLYEIDYFYHYVSKNYKDIFGSDIPGDNPEDGTDTIGTFDKPETNDIYYGVPGCGKSFIVNKKYASDENLYVRTVFHPDYTYTDFVGQVMPFSDNEKEIKYKKVAGPLTVAILKAKKNKGQRVTLIIEEINRGNAAAIFGDLFQLLDRKSTYHIENEFIRSYCEENNELFEGLLPNNLKIVATMNTSDQNVYVLDNAFRRRWNFIRVKNTIAPDDDESGLKDAVLAKSDIKWDDFYKIINDYIISDDETLLNNEDKRLGAYSVTKEQVENPEMFADKVLMYLWDNVARYNPSRWFKNYQSKEIVVYDQLMDMYLENDNLLDIFSDDLKNKFAKKDLKNE